jgi:VanZ family protein
MAAIFVASSLSDPPKPSQLPDPSLHALAYFVLCALLIRACAGGAWRGVSAARLAIAWAVAVIYGASDEWHQSFVPGRTPDLSDVFADAIGAFIAVIAAGAWDIIRRL